MTSKSRSIIEWLICSVLAIAQPCLAQQQTGIGIHHGRITQSVDSNVLSAGFTFRADFQWHFIEDAKQGVLSFPASLQENDALITSAAARGIRPIIILCYGNKYYDGGELPTSPAAIHAFANYARFIVNHFKGRVTQFEVWNEWNLNMGSKVFPREWGQAADYANLLRAASAAIKTENPEAVVIGGVVGGTDDKWIAKFIQAGGLTTLDAFSVHPYVQRHAGQTVPKPPVILEPSSAKTQVTALSVIPGTPEESVAWLDRLKPLIDAGAPGRTIPIYVTEIGWPTSIGDYGVPEAVAASYLQRFMLMARTRPWIAGVWWYDLQDDGPDVSNSEDRFGLLRQSGDPKPAYNALMQIKNFLQSPAPSTQAIGANGAILISGRYANNTKFAAAWLPTNDFARTESSIELANLIQSGYVPSTSMSAPSLGGTPLLLTK